MSDSHSVITSKEFVSTTNGQCLHSITLLHHSEYIHELPLYMTVSTRGNLNTIGDITFIYCSTEGDTDHTCGDAQHPSFPLVEFLGGKIK